jgi:D-serine deaminase-like pyridoxal phosphate-dependent protein
VPIRLPAGLPTPATVVLAERLQRNLTAMSRFAAEAGLALRPHAKTHKCVEIVRRQLAAGATGISVATVGEAEALTAALESDPPPVDDVFVAYPVWADHGLIGRLARLTERVRISVGADSAAGVERLAPLAGRIRLLVEVDCGLRRSGVAPAQAPAVAQAAERAGLDVAGVFTFPGHSYRPGAAEQAAADEARALRAAAEALLSAGFETPVRSGGSTPSARSSHPDALTELRPGVYALNDAQQVELGVARFADVALVVAATVVSRPADDRLVLDAGSKVLGADRPAWTSGYGRLPDWPEARITGLWEHHAVVASDGPGPELGDVVAVAPNHVCTAVNLVPELLVVSDGEELERWPVAARAANR